MPTNDFDNMNLSPEKIQQELDYFYTDHALKQSKSKGVPAGTFQDHKVVKFNVSGGVFYFLVKNNVPDLYLALSKYQDGFAVGNIRSNGAVKATEFYNYILDNVTKKLYSDKSQTSQGRKIWTGLGEFFKDITVTDVSDRLVATKDRAGSPAEVYNDI
jgi:hypothetical protein